MQSDEHVMMKEQLKCLLTALGWFALKEHCRCDVLAVCAGILAAFEVERSARNVMPNLARNFAQGCDRHIIAYPDFKTLREVARLLARQLPDDMHGKVGLCTFETLRMLCNHAPKKSV